MTPIEFVSAVFQCFVSHGDHILSFVRLGSTGIAAMETVEPTWEVTHRLSVLCKIIQNVHTQQGIELRILWV